MTAATEPPRAAVEAMRVRLVQFIGRLGRVRDTDAEYILRFAGTLPVADRWRLIAWLAEGIEPTEAMQQHVNAHCDVPDAELGWTWQYWMKAAAREDDDAR